MKPYRARIKLSILELISQVSPVQQFVILKQRHYRATQCMLWRQQLPHQVRLHGLEYPLRISKLFWFGIEHARLVVQHHFDCSSIEEFHQGTLIIGYKSKCHTAFS